MTAFAMFSLWLLLFFVISVIGNCIYLCVKNDLDRHYDRECLRRHIAKHSSCSTDPCGSSECPEYQQ